MIGVCSNGNAYNHSGSTSTVVSPMVTTGANFIKTKWDIILEPTKLIITNEDYV